MIQSIDWAKIRHRKTGNRLDLAFHQDDCMKWGCPYCGYRSFTSPIRAHGSAIMVCGECNGSFVMTASEEDVEFEANAFYVLVTHPREGTPSHGQPDERPAGGGEYFASRGLGRDTTPGCFVCGGERRLYHNIAGFAQCQESGERVVQMFQTGAFMDYRESEPDRIQVKVGACDGHCPNLQKLHGLTMGRRGRRGVITEAMIKEAVGE